MFKYYIYNITFRFLIILLGLRALHFYEIYRQGSMDFLGFLNTQPSYRWIARFS